MSFLNVLAMSYNGSGHANKAGIEAITGVHDQFSGCAVLFKTETGLGGTFTFYI